MKVVLELLDQPSNIRKITVRHDIVIGRGADCNLRLSAPQISRRHCFLRVSRDSVSVTDLDSSNGTYLNGKRIESGRRYDVVNGITLALGPIRFEVAVRSEKVAAEVLQVEALDDSINIEAPATCEPASTVMDMDGDQSSQDHRPLNYSIEHGGPSADDSEPTADLADGVTDEIVMDSEAEIVDLGRRISEIESSRRKLRRGPVEADQDFHTHNPNRIADTPKDAKLPDDDQH